MPSRHPYDLHDATAPCRESMTLSLDGSWQLRQSGESEQIPAQIPGCVHTDLLAAGKIEDPFVGMNEAGMRWVFQKDWIYQREFQVEADFLTHPHILLCCDGLDTVARIELNGQTVGVTDNMFRQWEFDVKPLLKAGRNHIEIHFESPANYIAAKQKIRPMNYPTARHQVAAFSQIRKAAYSFGWDWGPCLPTSGIWRPIRLQAFNSGRLRDVSINQDHSDPKQPRLTVNVTAEFIETENVTARILLRRDGRLLDQADIQIGRNTAAGNAIFSVKNPELWWPRGMGAQPLYEVSVELLDEKSRVFDQWTRRIGLRTLTLDLSRDKWGNSFSFQANGVPFFAKGTNWVPANALVTRLTSADYRRILTAAADVNMNMIRIWGGGIYEPDVFYDLCDELGLCVWQDFMFACAPYPLRDEEFTGNALAEIEQQIKRLRHHACLTLWCGNNEVEMCGFVAPEGDDMRISLEDYRGFFERKIPEMLETLAPGQAYWPGSPYKEAGKFYHPDVWIDNPGYGDTHNWSIWHLKKPLEAYRSSQHRFISEFGLQSYPEPSTVARFLDGGAADFNSPVMLHHQRSNDGNACISYYLRQWFKTPRNFEAALWCSQILHGMAMKIACEHWRRAMPRTMGTLIWQLNDAWPAASWAGIDIFGQWKAMHYMARRFYAPVLVSATEDEGKVSVYLTSDLQQPGDFTWSWKLTDLHGKEIQSAQNPILIPARTSLEAGTLDFQDDLSLFGAEHLLLWLNVANKEGKNVSADLVLFSKPKNLELPDPEISCLTTEVEKASATLTVTAQKPALWVWVESPGTAVHCSDNFFHLEPGIPVTIRIDAASAQWEPETLRVNSLFDTSIPQGTIF